MKTILLIVMMTLLSSGEEAWSRIALVPKSINELGQVMDADFGIDGKDVLSDYNAFFTDPKSLTPDGVLRLRKVFLYMNRRFLFLNNTNDHINIMIKQAVVHGKVLPRFDSIDGIMIAYSAYKNGGKYLNMEFDLDKRMEIKADTVSPITELDLEDKGGG